METREVPHVMPCLFPIRQCCTPGKSLAPIAATDHCDPAAYRKEFKEIYMNGLLRLLWQAKRRMLSRRGQHASLSYNMSLLPDSSRGSVLLRGARMGNNVPKEQVALGQGVHCRYWVLRILDGRARRAPALPLNTPERFASPLATGFLSGNFMLFWLDICPKASTFQPQTE
jgi:hypothetical protein